MIYLYLFGTCFHFIYVFMIIGNYKTSVYSCGTGHEPIKCKGLPFAETTPSYFMWNLL
jgi:hypothetical protein